ncbi:hypothetical protein Asppvi_004779 [Aspergillus pseudoviridinutans]|uniref:Uncharacterized protein n=1 Tax=Aspergillus pseudoviridinutans TaxID=1517512 RepID=A0A9P3ETR7_9EURO|nr:uncharacterized protein Asppvi_004779 [Aspergillus pseudoviridinutans]GIJ85912.1 hypothetical protein Asppvi_004779 [Aspergillus pseudoviridinutans]
MCHRTNLARESYQLDSVGALVSSSQLDTEPYVLWREANVLGAVWAYRTLKRIMLDTLEKGFPSQATRSKESLIHDELAEVDPLEKAAAAEEAEVARKRTKAQELLKAIKDKEEEENKDKDDGYCTFFLGDLQALDNGLQGNGVYHLVRLSQFPLSDEIPLDRMRLSDTRRSSTGIPVPGVEGASQDSNVRSRRQREPRISLCRIRSSRLSFSHALPFSHMPPQWGRVLIQFKYSLADEDWEAKACQQFFEAASALMRCGAPELTLTAYVQLRVVDGASGSGSVQLEFAFSKTQLQDCLTSLAPAIMDDIKVFLVSLSGGSTLQVQRTSEPTRSNSPLPVEEAPSETPNPDLDMDQTSPSFRSAPGAAAACAAPVPGQRGGALLSSRLFLRLLLSLRPIIATGVSKPRIPRNGCAPCLLGLFSGLATTVCNTCPAPRSNRSINKLSASFFETEVSHTFIKTSQETPQSRL